MKRTLMLIICSLFFCSLLFSAYDENKFMRAGKKMIANKQYDNAIKVFNFVIKKNPKNTNAIILAAFAHLKKGDRQTAIKYLTVAYNRTKDPRIKKQIDALSGQQPANKARKPPAKKETTKLINAGIKAGMNLANLTGQDVSPEAQMYMGLCVGGYIGLSFGPWFSIQPEFYYSEKGSITETSISVPPITYSYKSTLNLSYIEIPVLAKLSIQTGGAFVPVIYAGPAISILTNAILGTEVTANGETTKNQENVSEDMAKTDFGIVAGAGFEIKAGPGAITLDVRYNMGMSTIFNIEGVSEQPEAKTSSITILAGYAF